MTYREYVDIYKGLSNDPDWKDSLRKVESAAKEVFAKIVDAYAKCGRSFFAEALSSDYDPGQDDTKFLKMSHLPSFEPDCLANNMSDVFVRMIFSGERYAHNLHIDMRLLDDDVFENQVVKPLRKTQIEHLKSEVKHDEKKIGQLQTRVAMNKLEIERLTKYD